jgi:hypothetical protein
VRACGWFHARYQVVMMRKWDAGEGLKVIEREQVCS